MIRRKFLTGVWTLAAVILLCLGIFTACDNTEEPPVTTNYTVTFVLDGGTMAAENNVQVAEGAVIDLSEYIPLKTGYSFAGWSAGDITYAADSTLTANANITLTAQWNINEYTVTFKDGETVLKTETVEYGKFATAPAELTKTGYTFTGWDVAFDNVTSDLTVNAQWEVTKYAVTFDADGGVFESDETSVEHGTKLNFSDYIPKKAGYIFNGWKEGDTTYTANDSVTVTSAMEFVAQWTFAYKTEELSSGTLTVAGFAGDSLETIELPAEYNGKRITQIKDYAFDYDDAIKVVILEDMTYLESIGNGAFRSCANLETVSLNGLANLKTLGDSVFAGGFSTAGKLSSIDFTGCTGLESIGQMFFQYQAKLTTVDLTPCTSLTWIDRQMFDQCSALQTVRFPRSLQTINGDRGGAVNSDFFRSCDSLASISVQAGGLYFESSDGVLYLRGKTAIVKYPTMNEAAEYIAPSTVTTIYGSAFQNAINLTSIDLSACKELAEVMYSAFQGCSAAELTVPFDLNGYYQDSTQCILGSNWNRSVKNVVYGERYYFFEEDFSAIEDGMTTAQETLSFDAEVMYGEYVCSLTVLNTTTETEGFAGDDGSCSVALQEGANVITVTAYCEEKDVEKTFTFTVTLDDSLTVAASLSSEGLNNVSDGYKFTVSVQNVEGERISVQDKLKGAVDCGFSAPDYTDLIEGTLYTVTYNTDGKVATIALDFDTLLMWMYTVDEPFHLKISYAISAQETIEAIYEMQYTPAPTLAVSGIENGSEFNEDDTPEITIQAKEADGTAISSDRLSVTVDWGWGEQAFTFYEIVSKQDGTITIKLDCASCTMWSMGEAFTLSFVIENADGTEVVRESFTVKVTW